MIINMVEVEKTVVMYGPEMGKVWVVKKGVATVGNEDVGGGLLNDKRGGEAPSGIRLG